MSFRPIRSILAAALALTALPVLAQSQEVYSQSVFFGDSLTDSGFYAPFLIENVDPGAGAAARFTTNPGLVWAEFLADFYGTNATPAWQLGSTGIVDSDGDNYAAGGATIAPGPGFPPAPPTQFAPSLSDQIGAYLAENGGQADPNALFTVWGGANDLFFHLNGFTDQVTFLSAATDQVGLVATLNAAGARYILVPTMPDVGKTPFGMSLGPDGSAGVTQLVMGYNATLFGGLQAAGLRVIPLDTFNFLNEIIASPSTYGFSNVTSPACPGVPAALGFCNPSAFVTPDAPDTYAFADGVHPSTAAHQLLSQFAISVLEAPRQIAVLPHSAAMVGNARADMVGTRLMAKPVDDSKRWWGSARYDYQRYTENAGGDNFDGGGPNLTVGVDWNNGKWVYGAFGGFGKQGSDWGYRRGDFDQRDTTLGGYLAWYGDHLWINGQLSYTQLDFDIDRDVQLGPATRTHSGSADGDNFSAGINAGWDFNSGALRHGPVLTVLSQWIDVDGYAENNPELSTSLAYPDQRFDSLTVAAGWQASYAINDKLAPYVKLTWDQELEDAASEAFAQTQSIPGTLPFAVPGVQRDDSYVTLRYGTRAKVFGLDMLTGSMMTFNQKGGSDFSWFLTLGNSF